MKRKKIILLLISICLLFPSLIIAQTVEEVKFNYDINGNRIEREIITLDKSNKSQNIKSIIDSLNSSNIVIFPNPTSDIINITMDDDYSDSKVIVYNMIGEIVYSHNVYSKEVKIDLSKEINGVYILTISNKNKRKSWKIVKK